MAAVASRRLALAAAAIVVLGAASVTADPPASGGGAEPIRIVADLDDDDANLEADGHQARVPSFAQLPRITLDVDAVAPSRDAGFRVLRGERPVPPGQVLARGSADLRVQAVRAGRFEWAGRPLHSIEVRGMDDSGAVVDFSSSHASLTRRPPTRLSEASGDAGDLRILVRGVAGDLPSAVHLTSRAERGEVLDVLRDVGLSEVPCPGALGEDAGLRCAASVPIRAVNDPVDRDHPLARHRSLMAELGGAVLVHDASGDELQTLRVGGPRALPSAARRYRARLRVHVVRTVVGGTPAVGATDEEAQAIARREVSRANSMWAACGISFGPEAELDVQIVDPPPSHLLALGCDHGVLARGGEIRFRVGGRAVKVSVRPGDTPAEAARRVAGSLQASGYQAIVSDNRAIAAGALGTSDVLVRTPTGRMVSLQPPSKGAVSSDPSLPVCIGEVGLRDGLAHFSDADAIAGTVSERTLIKAFDDGDPGTIDVFVVESFEGGARIGESFIYGDGGGIRNVVIEDRGAVRADWASSALAHELGHVLLDSPGHPDDFTVDTPTRLMDADAMDPSAFGPRRLTAAECARAHSQGSGPRGSGILTAWPLDPLP